VDHRAGLGDVEKKKFLILPTVELRPLGRPARSAVAILTALSRTGEVINMYSISVRKLKGGDEKIGGNKKSKRKMGLKEIV
jgi:hypothetical protein